MLLYKKRCMRIFFAVEMAILTIIYVTGPEGVKELLKKEKENISLAHSIMQLQGQIEELEREQKKWKENSFYKEKLAREQLQMARPDDEVYFLV